MREISREDRDGFYMNRQRKNVAPEPFFVRDSAGRVVRTVGGNTQKAEEQYQILENIDLWLQQLGLSDKDAMDIIAEIQTKLFLN